MPSSKKTPNLLLNSWLGSDKPKKDDFNEDNQILDQSIGALRTQVGAVEQDVEVLQGQVQQELGEGLEELRGQLEQKLENTAAGLSGRIGTVETGLSGHKADAAAHVTAAERKKWDSGAMEIGGYTGSANTSSTQKVTLGYKPRFGIVFAIGVPPMGFDEVSTVGGQYTGFFGSGGCSSGITVDDTGFTVRSASGMLYGVNYRLNEQGQPYQYVVWK